VLARQTKALHHLANSVGKANWRLPLLATATAKSNVVAPGETYHAELGVASYYSAKELNIYMACNGKAVLIDANGVGLVRFRAPTRLDPTIWVGTIRVNQNGRDTTFHVTVPYRVVRR
jgi:hypothetical protein